MNTISGFVLAVGRKRVKQLEPKILSDKIENKKELKDPAKKSKVITIFIKEKFLCKFNY